MNIGIIGSGNMGASMGKAWARKGHTVLFSYSKDQNKLRAVADAAGPTAHTGTPAEAVPFGDVILLAAEEIARLTPDAKLVEALPPMAQILAANSHRLSGQQITTFYSGNDAGAKATVAMLLAELDLDPVDAGPLTSARYIEPAGMLVVPLAYGMGMGTNVGTKFLRG